MRIEESDGIFEFDAWSRFERGKESDKVLHQSIFSRYDDIKLNFSGKEIVQLRSFGNGRMETVFLRSLRHGTAANKPDTNIEATITVSWGGKDGVKGEASVSGSIKDENGGHGDATYSFNSDGESRIDVSGGKSSSDSGNSVDNTGQDLR